MTMLRRWDPFQEMVRWQDTMERLMDDRSSRSRLWGGRNEAFPLALDVSETEDSFIVRASIPGMDPDELEITVNDNILTIRGETEAEDEEEGEQYHIRERVFGSFIRSIALPSSVDRDNIQAVYEDGVLTLHLPKAQAAKPRRIGVNRMQTISGPSSSSASNGGRKKSQQSGNGRSSSRSKQQRNAEQSRSSSGGRQSAGEPTMEGAEGRSR